jgi:hypothetical protein
MAQYRKYSKKLHVVIVQSIRNGHTKTVASRAAGLNEQTLFDWLAMGRTQPDKYPEYVKLGEEIEQAKAEAEAEALDLIHAAAKSDPKHWTAAAWYLERTNPAEFSRRDRVEIEAGSKPLVQINQVVLVDEEARELARRNLVMVAGTPEMKAALLRGHDADVVDVPAEEVDDDA